MTKGLLYYTDNHCQERIMAAVRHQLMKCRNDMELIAVSHYPIENFGPNITVPFERGVLSMFKQMLIGLEHLEADFVFCVEHDVLYHPSHFEFTPPKRDVFYFNSNVWSANADTGECLHYDGMKKTSCLVADRSLLITHYRRKIKIVEREGWNTRIGYEPGKRLGNYEYFESEHPNVDIKHGQNLVRWRGRLEQYRCRESIRDSWQLTDKVPGWGVVKGRFDDFLRGVYSEGN